MFKKFTCSLFFIFIAFLLSASDTIFQRQSLVFVKNNGQEKRNILFYSWFPKGTAIYADRIIFNGVEIKIKNRNSQIIVEGTKLLQGKFNYFGNIPAAPAKKEITDIPSYGNILYKNIYPFIDLGIEGVNNGKIELIWYVYPGGNVDDICLEVPGGKISMTGENEIVITKKKIKITMGKIYAFQKNKDNAQEKINVQYRISKNHIEYLASNYDKNAQLTIDPITTAIIASNNVDYINGLAIDASGNVFAAGYTLNQATFNPSRTIFGTLGSNDAFVTKFDNGLTIHLATAIICGSGSDVANAIAIDGSGDIFITGSTSSADFAPTRTTFGTAGGAANAFITKLNNNLTTHIATAIITGGGTDLAYALAIDGSGNIFAAGTTGTSSNFAPSRTNFGSSGNWDAFVTKFNNTLTSHLATAIIRGGGTDYAYALAIDGSGNVFSGGTTDLETNFSPSRTIYGTVGGNSAFVTKLNNTLTTHLATAIITGGGNDYTRAIAIDASLNIFIAGYTLNSTNFSSSRTVFGTTGGSSDAFITKFDNTLSTHIATAIVTGNSEDNAYAIAIEAATGNVVVAGSGNASNDFAPSRNVYGVQGPSLGIADAYVSRFDNTLTTHLSTDIITGSNPDIAYALAIDGSGNIFAAGITNNYLNFSSSRTVFGTTAGGESFITKIDNYSSLPVELLSLTANCENNLVKLNWQTATEINNDYFTIERSINGKTFEAIGKMQGTGNSSTIQQYEFTDPLPNGEGWGGALYYRLKQTDYNGKYEYFPPISVICSPADEWNLLLQGTPFTDQLLATLQSPEDGNVQIEISDLYGKKISSSQLGVIKGSNLLRLDLKNILQGFYFLNIYNNEKQITKKFIKL
ncbi:MAG: SBBP repeat-containing protein [Bacteroidetes bacterium]|nr:SBBP repeat-containing protein [Bacteroidota bacterium]